MKPIRDAMDFNMQDTDPTTTPHEKRRLYLTPLEQEPRAALPTAEAAAHLGRAEQTLRLWACNDNGPIRPRRINGRLAWPVDAIRELLGVAAHA